MFDEGHDDSIVQCGIDEALACRDVLEAVPAQPSALARDIARIMTAAPADLGVAS